MGASRSKDKSETQTKPPTEIEMVATGSSNNVDSDGTLSSEGSSSFGLKVPSSFDVTQYAAGQGENYLVTSADYLSKRKLYRGASAVHIWALAVGAVISGEFFGWNLGYQFGGLANYIVSMSVITVMFFCITLILAEMSSALPFAGGAYAFARATLGKFLGCYSGLSESLEYLTATGSIIWFLSGQLCYILGVSDSLTPLAALIMYCIIIPIHCWGGLLMWGLVLVLPTLSVLWLLVYFFGTIKDWSGGHNLDVIAGDANSRWFSDGVGGFFAALAPAVWFYLGVEEVPLAAEEVRKPKRDIAIGIITGGFTLYIVAWMVLLSVAFTPPGVSTAIGAAFPLSEGYNNIFGGNVSGQLLSLCSIVPLFTSAYCIAFAYGRQIFAMARAGYLPSFLSIVTPKRGTPGVALTLGALATYITMIVIYYGTSLSVSDIMFSVAVMTALQMYGITSIAFIIMRIKYAKDIDRPFKAPLGIPIALFVVLTSLTALICSFIFISDFLYGLIICGGYFGFWLGYYLIWSRKRLRISPEEQFAMFCLYRTKVQNETYNRVLRPQQSKAWRIFSDLFS